MQFKKYTVLFFLLGFFCLSCIFALKSNAQMMGNITPTITPTQEDLQDIQTGKDLYGKFQNQQVTCTQLHDDDFEKIGEYIMDQQFGNTTQHIQMNEHIKQMMGTQGEENMHIAIGRSATNCNTQGGDTGMMGNWGWTGGQMMGGSWFGVFSVFAFLFWIVGLIDLILLGIFLWKKISKK